MMDLLRHHPQEARPTRRGVNNAHRHVRPHTRVGDRRRHSPATRCTTPDSARLRRRVRKSHMDYALHGRLLRTRGTTPASRFARKCTKNALVNYLITRGPLQERCEVHLRATARKVLSSNPQPEHHRHTSDTRRHTTWRHTTRCTQTNAMLCLLLTMLTMLPRPRPLRLLTILTMLPRPLTLLRLRLRCPHGDAHCSTRPTGIRRSPRLSRIPRVNPLTIGGLVLREA